jgi:RNA polymerase sigma-70 factor (ECF subfamily)
MKLVKFLLMNDDAARSLSGLLDTVDLPQRQRLSQIFPLIYDDLRRIAGRYMSRQSSDHTLQPTALVNEAFLRIRDGSVATHGTEHVLALAAIAMRCILVDHARARSTEKRGGNLPRAFALSPNDEPAGAADTWDVSILELNELLGRLADLHPRRARVVELRFFGGMTNDEVASTLDIARSTVAEDWAVARAWLRVQLSPGAEPGAPR